MESIQTRCCIAGGGPAGVMLGYLLARAGIDTVILEKWPDFFRDFRGDTIHPSTMQVLYELGLLDEFMKLPHNEMEKMTAHIGGKEVTVADFSRLRARTPFIAFIPQWDFLNFLSEKGKEFLCFRLMMETEATDLIEEDGHATGIIARRNGKTFEIRAELIVGADGRHSMVREKSGLPIIDLDSPIDVLWFRLPRHDDGTKQSLGYIDGGEALILLDRDDYWQCGFVIKKGGFEAIKAGGLGAFQQKLVALAPFLASAAGELRGWDQVKLLSVSVDRLTRWYREGLICIGDAAHAMSPVGGVGINLAIQDAVAAGNILIPAFKNGTPKLSDLADIERRREYPVKATQRIQVFLHRHLLEPILSKGGHLRSPWFMQFLKIFPPLTRIPARIIGIGFRPEHVKEK